MLGQRRRQWTNVETAVSQRLVFTTKMIKYKMSWNTPTLCPLSFLTGIFTHFKLRLATATRNFKRVKITHMCFICDETFANPQV